VLVCPSFLSHTRKKKKTNQPTNQQEKLQQQFNQTVFELEQKEYEKEKIDWSYIAFNDNQECLDLIEKKPSCILAILDDECKFPKATDSTFAQKLVAAFASSKNAASPHHPHFEKPRFSNTQFSIRHYAGTVTYSAEGFLDKNKDFIVPDHVQMMEKSNFEFVRGLFANFWQSTSAQVPSKSKGTYQFVSVASQFRDSLNQLMESIHATNPHYIRCIKPNNRKKPNLFNKLEVLHQLRCGGVLECIRISRAGYPTRRPYHQFLERYKLLARKTVYSTQQDLQKQTHALLEALRIDSDKFQLGLTKIFLRAGTVHTPPLGFFFFFFFLSDWLYPFSTAGQIGEVSRGSAPPLGAGHSEELAVLHHVPQLQSAQEGRDPNAVGDSHGPSGLQQTAAPARTGQRFRASVFPRVAGAGELPRGAERSRGAPVSHPQPTEPSPAGGAAAGARSRGAAKEHSLPAGPQAAAALETCRGPSAGPVARQAGAATIPRA
jgi:hypothetical protein